MNKREKELQQAMELVQSELKKFDLLWEFDRIEEAEQQLKAVFNRITRTLRKGSTK